MVRSRTSYESGNFVPESGRENLEPSGSVGENREQYQARIANDHINDRGVDVFFGSYRVIRGLDRNTMRLGPLRVYEGKMRGYKFTVEPAKTDSQKLVTIPYEAELPAEEKDEAPLPSVKEISERYAEEDDADVESITFGPDGEKQVRYKPDKPVH